MQKRVSKDEVGLAEINMVLAGLAVITRTVRRSAVQVSVISLSVAA